MDIIPPIPASGGETNWSPLYIDVGKSAASSNLHIVAYLVAESEVSQLFI